MFQAGYFPPTYFSPEWWDEVDATTIPGGCFLLALHGTGGAGEAVEEGRRPKASQLNLLKFKESRAWAQHAKAAARAHPVTARGEHAAPAYPSSLTGAVRATGAKAQSKGKSVGVRAAGGSCARSAVLQTRNGYVSSCAAGGAAVMSARADTSAFGAASRGVARVMSHATGSSTTASHVGAAGVRRLSDAEIVAIVRATIDKRR